MSKPHPVGYDAKLSADIFNRLAWLQHEGHHHNQCFHIDRVLWGVLTAMGICIDMQDVESSHYYFGPMLDGSFHEMKSTDVEWLVEKYGKAGAQ